MTDDPIDQTIGLVKPGTVVEVTDPYGQAMTATMILAQREHNRHLRAGLDFLRGRQWHVYVRTRWWWKPWTWARPAGHWVDPRAAFEAHLAQHVEQLNRRVWE